MSTYNYITDRLLSLADDSQKQDLIHQYLYNTHSTEVNSTEANDWKVVIVEYRKQLVEYYGGLDIAVDISPILRNRIVACKACCDLFRKADLPEEENKQNKKKAATIGTRLLGEVTGVSMHYWLTVTQCRAVGHSNPTSPAPQLPIADVLSPPRSQTISTSSTAFTFAAPQPSPVVLDRDAQEALREATQKAVNKKTVLLLLCLLLLPLQYY
jgi:hypothetical protein